MRLSGSVVGFVGPVALWHVESSQVKDQRVYLFACFNLKIRKPERACGLKRRQRKDEIKDHTQREGTIDGARFQRC